MQNYTKLSFSYISFAKCVVYYTAAVLQCTECGWSFYSMAEHKHNRVHGDHFSIQSFIKIINGFYLQHGSIVCKKNNQMQSHKHLTPHCGKTRVYYSFIFSSISGDLHELCCVCVLPQNKSSSRAQCSAMQQQCTKLHILQN